jgi:hypothetical protein
MIGRRHYVTTCARFSFLWIFSNTIWLNSNVSQFWWERELIHTFVFENSNFIHGLCIYPSRSTLPYFFPKIMTISYGTYRSNFNKSATNSKKSYIVTIRAKRPSPVIGPPMRSTYLENFSGVTLTFVPSGRFTKTHAFCTKNGNSNFVKQSLKPNLEELFVMRSCTHLRGFWVLYHFVCSCFLSTRSLGSKNLVKSYMVVLFLNTFLKKTIHIVRLVCYMIGRRHYVTTCARFSFV